MLRLHVYGFFIKMSVVYHRTCPSSRGAAALFDSLLKTIINMSMSGVVPNPAPCRSVCRAAFRRTACEALVEKEAA